MRPSSPSPKGEGTGGEDQVDQVRHRADDREGEDRRRGIERVERGHVKITRQPNAGLRHGHGGRDADPPRTVLTVVLDP